MLYNEHRLEKMDVLKIKVQKRCQFNKIVKGSLNAGGGLL